MKAEKNEVPKRTLKFTSEKIVGPLADIENLGSRASFKGKLVKWV